MKQKSTEDLYELIELDSESFLDNIDENKLNKSNVLLSEYFNELLSRHKMTPRDLVVRSNISQSHVYQMITGTKGVGRDKLLVSAIAMGLDLEETQKLLTLGQCGVLYPKVRRDAAIICCIKEHMDLYDTNECLRKINENEL